MIENTKILIRNPDKTEDHKTLDQVPSQEEGSQLLDQEPWQVKQMAYLEGLIYKHSHDNVLAETRQGIPHYNGSAYGLAEWKFKVLAKKRALGSVKDQDERNMKMTDLAGKVTDGLTDDALKVAMDIGEELLIAPGGLDVLIKSLEEHVVSFRDDEARDLFHAGTKRDGPMSRQPSETMSSYIARRKRWTARLSMLDSNTKVSDNILVPLELQRHHRGAEALDPDRMREQERIRGDRCGAQAPAPKGAPPRKEGTNWRSVRRVRGAAELFGAQSFQDLGRA